MRTHLTRRTIPWTLAAALLLAAGCGDDDTTSEGSDGDSAAPAETAAGDSAYCDAAAEWSVYAAGGFDDSDPAAFEAYWQEFNTFEAEALAHVPEEIKADWELKVESENETIDPVLEKYDYDTAAIMESGTPAEQAAFEAPPDVQAAQDRIHLYESEICGAQQPAPADVSYAEEEPGPYCELAMAQNERAGEALASGDPAAIEAVFDSVEEGAAALTEAAPAVIKDDVIEWSLGTRSSNVKLPSATGTTCSPPSRRAPRRTATPSTTATRTSATSTPECSPTKSRCAVRERERSLGLVRPSAQVAEGHRPSAQGLVGQSGAAVAEAVLRTSNLV